MAITKIRIKKDDLTDEQQRDHQTEYISKKENLERWMIKNVKKKERVWHLPSSHL